MSRRARIRSVMVSDGRADDMRELEEREESTGKGGLVRGGTKRAGGRMGDEWDTTCICVVRRVIVIVYRSGLGSFELGVFDFFEFNHIADRRLDGGNDASK